MKKTINLSFGLLVFIALSSSSAFGWKTNKGNPAVLGTHERLTDYAIKQYSILKACVEQNNRDCDVLKEVGIKNGLDEKLTWENREAKVWNWLILGADREDAGTLINMASNSARFNNHFHNPLTNWENSGLSDSILLPPFFLEGKSSLLWAQDSSYQSQQKWLGGNKWPEGDWTWEKTREYYFAALNAVSEAERQSFFARMFKGLGHQAHLLQDKAVPAHVRNDAHPLPWHMEKWMAENLGVMDCLIKDHSELHPALILKFCTEKDENGDVVYDAYGDPVLKFEQVGVVVPEVLSLDVNNLNLDPAFNNYYGTDRKLEKTALLTDTDQYGSASSPSASYLIGLAEYTNGNFFSDDTIFAETEATDDRHYFPNPSRGSTNLSELEDGNIIPRTIIGEDGIPDRVKCVAKNAPGEEVDCLVRAGYLTDMTGAIEFATQDYVHTFILDAPVHESYVKHLVPRATGYTAALIDYFFRGRMDIQEPFFSFGGDHSITGIHNLQVQNISSLDNGQTIENFGPGELRLVYYYTPDGVSEPVYRLVDNWVYQINDTSSLINSDYATIDKVSFDANETVPPEIAPGDVTFLLVFKGQLGDEENAVAAQSFTGITNSRIAYHYQPGGQPNLSNTYTISPDGSNPYQLTGATEETSWYFSPTWSRDGTKMAFENHFCTDQSPDLGCPMEFYYRNIVVIDPLSEHPYPGNVLHEFNYDGAPLGGPSFSPDGTRIAAIMQNQSGFAYNANVVVYNLETGEHWIVNFDDDPHLTDLGGSGVAWSPTEDKIAYYLNQQYDETSRRMEFEGDLFLINPDGTGKVRLTDDDFVNIQPSWSPDGEWIVFSSDRDGEESMDIWMMDKSGENLSRLVDCTPASCYVPTFSPDGRKVAFSNGSSIYTVNSNGDPYSLKEIAHPGLVTGALNWSPFLAPPSLEIQAEPNIISMGGMSTLSWQSSRATEVTVSGIGEKQGVNGTIQVAPDSTTTYILTATGPLGTVEQAITVTVQ